MVKFNDQNFTEMGQSLGQLLTSDDDDHDDDWQFFFRKFGTKFVFSRT